MRRMVSDNEEIGGGEGGEEQGQAGDALEDLLLGVEDLKRSLV